MDAIELLKTDHELVAQLFAKAEATENDKEKEKIFEKIKMALEAHTHIEETIFYPALEENEEFKDITLEAYEEHKQVKTLIREISNLADGSEKFDAKLTVMQENVEHHVEEEETEMFPKVRKFFSAEDLEEMGQEMETAKNEYNKTYKSRSASK